MSSVIWSKICEGREGQWGREILGGIRHQIVRQLLHYSRSVIFIKKLYMLLQYDNISYSLCIRGSWDKEGMTHQRVVRQNGPGWGGYWSPEAQFKEGKLKWKCYVCYLHSCPDNVEMIRCYPTLHRKEVQDNLALLDNLNHTSKHERQTHQIKAPNEGTFTLLLWIISPSMLTPQNLLVHGHKQDSVDFPFTAWSVFSLYSWIKTYYLVWRLFHYQYCVTT